jgi:outer membrane protein assembly factor BamB
MLCWTLVATSTLIHAQGRGGGAWTTAGGDAQRTGSVRTDPRLSKDTASKMQLLWKRQLNPKALALTQPVLLPNIISYKGFKALAFLGGGDVVYSIDYDLNRMFWERRLNTSPNTSSATACPAGLTAVTRPTLAGPPAAGGGRFGGGGGGGGRGNNNVYAVSSGGMVHALNPQTGDDVTPPAKFLSANARLSGTVLIDNVLYAAATGNCAGVANGVYAIDVAENANTVTSWDSKGAAIAGSLGPAFAPDGTLYVATGAASGDSTFANAVVALEARTLKAKDWFTASAPFTSSPAVFTQGGKTLVAASSADGSVYVLDAAALGGADHRTPLAKSSPSVKGGDVTAGAMATWEDASSVRWLAVGSDNGIVAFRVSGETPDTAWTSREIPSPGAPMVLNGVVLVVSNGAASGRGSRGKPSVLYALDAATGKELWNSGNAITSSVPGVPPSGGDGQVYVVTTDGTLYAFGIPMER